ncbi:MAG: PqiC family protein [Thermodesulfobacteriota bacterium]
MLPRFPALAAVLFCALVGFTACATTPPARFYTLSSLPGPGKAQAISTTQRRQVVGIGPIALAQYLDHPAITTRSGDTTLVRSEFDRWGGTLADEISRVLVENMGTLLPGERFLVLPWLETAAIDYRMQLHITRFEAERQQAVTLNVAWLLFDREGRTPLASGDVALREPVRAEGYGEVTAAMSRALAELSRQIAAAIGDAAASAAGR